MTFPLEEWLNVRSDENLKQDCQGLVFPSEDFREGKEWPNKMAREWQTDCVWVFPHSQTRFQCKRIDCLSAQRMLLVSTNIECVWVGWGSDHSLHFSPTQNLSVTTVTTNQLCSKMKGDRTLGDQCWRCEKGRDLRVPQWERVKCPSTSLTEVYWNHQHATMTLEPNQEKIVMCCV